MCESRVPAPGSHSGHWLLVVRSISIRSRQAVYAEQTMEQSAAQEKLLALKRDGLKLSAALGNLRKAIS